MKLNKILKELKRTYGDDGVKNCVIFWESPEGTCVSMFPVDKDSFVLFMARVALIIENPENYTDDFKHSPFP